MKRLIDDKILKNEILPGQSEDGGTLYRTTIGTNYDLNDPTGIAGEELIIPANIKTINGDNLYINSSLNTSDLYVNNALEALNLTVTNVLTARRIDVKSASVTKTSGKIITELGTIIAEHSKHAVFVANQDIPVTASTTVSNLALSDGFFLPGLNSDIKNYKYKLYDDTDGTYFGYLSLTSTGTERWKITVTITVANKTHTIKQYDAINIYDVYIG